MGRIAIMGAHYGLVVLEDVSGDLRLAHLDRVHAVFRLQRPGKERERQAGAKGGKDTWYWHYAV
jgi:hypothetical protein